ncbi:hypothetical protein KVR01_003425 [Diaporthe batatas]|uniref:uncharacterized protein n=1 Tax=Diaporthe batatas TaxID=748121 RepID=UPI001D03B722|nr:uncharacterized protein KVR01_003425 [Diaporthe batatas]KAG8167736.1 hypothetical protein KVR01_003425 [Diaporthe batatas]
MSSFALKRAVMRSVCWQDGAERADGQGAKVRQPAPLSLNQAGSREEGECRAVSCAECAESRFGTRASRPHFLSPGQAFLPSRLRKVTKDGGLSVWVPGAHRSPTRRTVSPPPRTLTPLSSCDRHGKVGTRDVELSCERCASIFLEESTVPPRSELAKRRSVPAYSRRPPIPTSTATTATAGPPELPRKQRTTPSRPEDNITQWQNRFWRGPTRLYIWAFCSPQTTRQVDFGTFETSWGAFQSSKTLGQPLGDCVFGCIHADSRCHHKKDMLEKLLGYSRGGPSAGGFMEIRDSGMALTVITRGPKEPSSDYIRGMVTMVNFAFFDSLLLPMFITLPVMQGPGSIRIAMIMMLCLVVATSFVVQLFMCRQVAFYRLILVLGVSLSVRYWYTTQLCGSGLLAKLCPQCLTQATT